MKQTHHVTSRNRLRGFDYSSPGYYFLTCCTNNRVSIFGCVEGESTLLSPEGEMIRELIESLNDSDHLVTVDSYVIMPNHIHLLIYLSIESESISISNLVRHIKGVSTAKYRKGIAQDGWKPIQGPLWQKKFYDHIVRNEKELFFIRKYISENPPRWEIDELYRDE